MPEGPYEQASENTFRGENLPSIAEEAVTTAEQATATAERATANAEEATTTAQEATTTAQEEADTFRPPHSTPAAPSLENKEVATNIDVLEKIPSAIQDHAPSTPLTPPPATAVQEEPATAASFAGSDGFTAWMNCSKDADLDTMLFGRLRIPITAQVCFTSKA